MTLLSLTELGSPCCCECTKGSATSTGLDMVHELAEEPPVVRYTTIGPEFGSGLFTEPIRIVSLESLRATENTGAYVSKDHD
jgi:hypothetical protein